MELCRPRRHHQRLCRWPMPSPNAVTGHLTRTSPPLKIDALWHISGGGKGAAQVTAYKVRLGSGPLNALAVVLKGAEHQQAIVRVDARCRRCGAKAEGLAIETGLGRGAVTPPAAGQQLPQTVVDSLADRH